MEIEIPDLLYERLQRLAVPFIDTPATVIERCTTAYEANLTECGPTNNGDTCFKEADCAVQPDRELLQLPTREAPILETNAAGKLGVSSRQTAGNENRPTVRATLGTLKNGRACNVAPAIRWMGKDRWSFREVRTVLDSIGLGGSSGVKDATIRAQLQSGQHHPDGIHGPAGDLDDNSIRVLRTLRAKYARD